MTRRSIIAVRSADRRDRPSVGRRRRARRRWRTGGLRRRDSRLARAGHRVARRRTRCDPATARVRRARDPAGARQSLRRLGVGRRRGVAPHRPRPPDRRRSTRRRCRGPITPYIPGHAATVRRDTSSTERCAQRLPARRARRCSTGTRRSAPIVDRGFVRGATRRRPRRRAEFEARAEFTVIADGANSRFGRALGTFRQPTLAVRDRARARRTGRRCTPRPRSSSCSISATEPARRSPVTDGCSRPATAPSTSACC